MSSRQKFEYLAIRHPLTIALGYFSMFIFGMCIASFVSNPRKHYDSLISLVLHVTLSVMLFIFARLADLVLFVFSAICYRLCDGSLSFLCPA